MSFLPKFASLLHRLRRDIKWGELIGYSPEIPISFPNIPNQRVARSLEVTHPTRLEVALLHTKLAWKTEKKGKNEEKVLRFENVVLKERVSECEGDVLFLKTVVAEKRTLEDYVSSLERDKISLGATISQLKQENEGLSIQLEILERDLLVKEKIMEECSTVSPEFGYGVDKFQDACVAAGKALGMQEEKELVCASCQLKGMIDDVVDYQSAAEEVLDAFDSFAYMSVLELDKLDAGKLRQMVQSRVGTGSS
ncbi:unnamed protein product [Lactuca virosa]|uniref:Uncharacterized protein n=1 Tax=Lactuca virosa TaxID=75947 RepID=A0AAU9MEM9_9ASTR|nr:unnamed protein product [Lactuca virosa]